MLLIRPSALGDVCRTVPVLVSLRRAWPGATIDWVVQDTFVEAVEAHPGLSGVVPFPRSASLGTVLRWLGDLRRKGYDLALDCQGLARSGLIAWWSGARVRIGDRGARELAWLGYTVRVRQAGRVHTVDRMLGLVEALGVPAVRDLRLYPPAAAVERVQRDAQLSGRYAVLAPGARWPGKQWPAERFAEVARALLDRVDRVVLVGSSGERARCAPLLERARGEARIVDRIGRTGVGDLMAVLAKAALVIANDSAALHMAVGLGRPIVGLYGPTDVGLVGPYGRVGDVIQHLRPGDRIDHKDARAGAELMGRITVEEVVRAAEARLG